MSDTVGSLASLSAFGGTPAAPTRRGAGLLLGRFIVQMLGRLHDDAGCTSAHWGEGNFSRGPAAAGRFSLPAHSIDVSRRSKAERFFSSSLTNSTRALLCVTSQSPTGAPTTCREQDDIVPSAYTRHTLTNSSE